MSTDSSKKLRKSAKAFVPQSVLKASALTWSPVPSDSKDDKEPEPDALSEPPADAPTPPPASEEPKKTEVKKAPAPPPVPVIAWGKKSSSAIRSAPSQEQQQQRPSRSNSNNNNNNKRDSDKGGWRNQRNPHNDADNNNNRNKHEKGGNWRQKDKNNNRNNRNNNNNNNKDQEDDGWQRGRQVPLDLIKPGEGDTDACKAVKRVLVQELLAMRLSYLAAPLAWIQADDSQATDDENATETPTTTVGPPKEVRWISDTRVQEIDAASSKSRLGGDASSGRRKKKDSNDTAPALEDCKPLEVNDGTRWKANVFKKKDSSSDDNAEHTETDDVILKKALLIMNKLSLTKFDKLSDAFIDTGIGNNESCLAGAIELIVKKAQDEPHFAAMYAALCMKLSRTHLEFEASSKKKNKFKKMLLTICQKEFEVDTDTKIANAIEGIEEEEERELKKAIIKKHYLGHMRFIGELYKGDLISIKIMLHLLPKLLEGKNSDGDESVDEEKVECFVKLMTVIGLILEQQSIAMKDIKKTDPYEKLTDCWETVEKYAGKLSSKFNISNRIKFMLQDLLEMRAKGWVTRRKEESAQTIAQIHKEAAKEARRGSSGINRSVSSNNFRPQTSKPTVDADGFTSVVNPSGGGFNRSQSLGNFKRSGSQNNMRRPSGKNVSRSQSGGGSFASLNENSKSNAGKSSKSPKRKETTGKSSAEKTASAASTVEYKTPKECGDKAKNYLKEFFVGGDADDAVLSIHELIGTGADGSVDRGAKVVESSLLMVMEMKADEVEKVLSVILRCYNEKKLEADSIAVGLKDPLEFLMDIEIDAPLARSHLVTAMAEFIKAGAISFDYLLGAPEYFRTDCDSARFGCKVLNKIGNDAATDSSNVEVIEKLMTDDDRAQHPTAKDLLAL